MPSALKSATQKAGATRAKPKPKSKPKAKSKPKIKPAMNAYMFYQKANLIATRKQLESQGIEPDFARTQQALAARWRTMTPLDRRSYETQAAADRVLGAVRKRETRKRHGEEIRVIAEPR